MIFIFFHDSSRSTFHPPIEPATINSLHGNCKHVIIKIGFLDITVNSLKHGFWGYLRRSRSVMAPSIIKFEFRVRTTHQ